jgi:hypothetical protein
LSVITTIIRKTLIVIAALVVGGAFGYASGPLIHEDIVLRAVKYVVLTGWR